ncbi:MAG: MATE family efflux transporter [Alphaproteobacteria bacterium]|nr:MATE family efflux transporter [Alphaproteobacteria bacterium]
MIKDLTKGTPLKLLIQFATPIFIGNVFQQLFQISDILIVGRLLGVNSLAAVGASAPLFFMFLMIAFGFTGGLTIITAQRFGARDVAGIKSSVFHSCIAASVLCVVISLCLILFLKPLLRIMNIPNEIMPEAYSFMLILGLAFTPIIFYNLLSGFMRALGDSKTPLYFLIFTSVVNLALNFIFVYYCKLGVAGSAMGTLVSIILTVIGCIVIIAKKFPLLKISSADCRYRPHFMSEHLKVAAPMAIQFSILSFSMMIVQSVCNSFGTGVIAGFTAAMRIEQISTQPLFALGISYATFAAQNFGASLIHRIRQGVTQCLLFGLALSIVIGLSVRFYGSNMVSVFIENNDANIIHIGQEYLMISTYFYFCLLCIFITRNALQGMGYTKIPLISGVVELVLRAFAAIYLAKIIGYTGIFWAGPIAWLGGAVVVCTGYWIVIRRLNSKKMRKIFQRKLISHL